MEGFHRLGGCFQNESHIAHPGGGAAIIASTRLGARCVEPHTPGVLRAGVPLDPCESLVQGAHDLVLARDHHHFVGAVDKACGPIARAVDSNTPK